MKKALVLLLLFFAFLSPALALAVEIAPRISDREIIEKLARLEEGQNTIRAEIKANSEAIKQLREDNAEAIRQLREDNTGSIKQLREDNAESIKQLREDNAESIKQLREDNAESIKQLREDIRWMFGTLVTIAVVVLGFMLSMQWQMYRRQAQMETTLETHKDELSFLKSLIEKLLPPKGVL
jgi:gas vesicle protein